MKSNQHSLPGPFDALEDIRNRLSRIEEVLETILLPKQQKRFYSTSEVAAQLKLSKWYVRRLCSIGEIKAKKHPGNGRFLISAQELERIVTRRDFA